MKRAAFTYVEVLAAMAFLAILMPIIVAALSLCSRTSEAAERSTIAAQLADNQLHQVLLDGTWTTGTGRGDFGANWPSYHWELSKRTWSEGVMSELTMTVSFPVQGREQSVKLVTLASDAQATNTSSSTGSAAP